MLIPTDDADSTPIRTTGLVESDSMPTELRASVTTTRRSCGTPTPRSTTPVARVSPALAIGSEVRVNTTGEQYEVYFLFPLTAQSETLDVVQTRAG